MEALSYKLEGFEGPLDLLLQLIQKHKFDIYDVPLAELCDQYIIQIERMQAFNLDVASEFLEMAARLVYLKTVSLLPRHEEAEELKQELTGELLEYRACRQLAARLAEMTEGFGRFVRPPEPVEPDKTYTGRMPADKLLQGYLNAVGRGQRRLPPPTTVFSKIVAKKIVSVSSRIIYVLRTVFRSGKQRFASLFASSKSRSEAVATFLAVLELIKARRVRVDGEGENARICSIREGKKHEA